MKGWFYTPDDRFVADLHPSRDSRLFKKSFYTWIQKTTLVNYFNAIHWPLEIRRKERAYAGVRIAGRFEGVSRPLDRYRFYAVILGPWSQSGVVAGYHFISC